MSSLTKVFLLAANDLRLVLRDRAALIWLVAFPLTFIWLFGQIFQPPGPVKIGLAVEDRDGGWLARSFVAGLADPAVLLTEVVAGEPREGKSRTLVIPEGFTAGVLAGERQTLRLEAAEGSRVQFDLGAQAHVVRAITRTLARLAEAAAAGNDQDPTPEALAALAGREPLVTVDVSTAGRGRVRPAGFNLSVPGTLTMIVLMMSLIYGGATLAAEKQTGMLRRQSTLPILREQIVFGKLAGRFLIAGVQVAFLVLAGRWLFGVSWGDSALGLLLMLGAYTFAVAGIATFLGAVVKTPDQASGVGWLASMVMAALGGCWWPSEVMPGWLRTAAHVFPTAWAMDGFHALISFGRGVEAVLLPAAVLAGFGVAFSWLGARNLDLD